VAFEAIGPWTHSVPAACSRAEVPNWPRAMVAEVAEPVWAVTTTISGAPSTLFGSRMMMASAEETAARFARPAEFRVVAAAVRGASVTVPKTLSDLMRVMAVPPKDLFSPFDQICYPLAPWLTDNPKL
jgi:hypothetical protein